MIPRHTHPGATAALALTLVSACVSGQSGNFGSTDNADIIRGVNPTATAILTRINAERDDD